jgi:hypothetical protein
MKEQNVSELFLSIDQKPMDTIKNWLNGLVGYSMSYGRKVTKILEWQVIPTGRPYEYSAIARVEIQG